MDYKEKYIFYKQKYLLLKYGQTGGGKKLTKQLKSIHKNFQK